MSPQAASAAEFCGSRLEGRQGCSSGASTDLRLTVGISRTVVTLGVEWRFPGQSVRFLEGSENSLFVLPRMARSDKQRTLETAPDRLDVTTQRGEHSSHLEEPGRRGRERPQGRGLLSHWFARAISCTAWLSLIWAKVFLST